MREHDLKEKILQAAITTFDKEGFQGASIRKIADLADCSLPMLYYHYKNKTSIYEEISINQFFLIIKRLNSELDFSAHPVDLYAKVVLQRRDLDQYEKSVYRIASRLWLGFEGVDNLRNKIIDWEQKRIEQNRRILDRYVKNSDDKQLFAEVFLGFIENEVNKIVFFDKKPDETQLKAQLQLILRGVM